MKKRSQQIDRYSEVMENYAVIHAGSNDGTGYTLCGAALEGENGDNEMLHTRRRITCRRCIGIIRYCKSIPNRVLNAGPITSQQPIADQHGEKK